MTETNGWPGQPGGPLNPEKDGWHWCLSPLGDDLFPCFWRAAGEASNLKWPGKWLYRRNDWNPKECTYLGPVLTPDEAAALQARADQAALGHAREADRADQSEFLHKQEIAALQKRVAKLEALVKSAFTEGFNAGHEQGEELGEFTANGGDARRHESRGPIWHWQSSETKATLEGKKDE